MNDSNFNSFQTDDEVEYIAEDEFEESDESDIEVSFVNKLANEIIFTASLNAGYNINSCS